ncbi:MAG: type II toxin-antitoxin system RelE/ParE family toxin [Deltaproteobacteria bacterium]|nr:type II toxin-antitoxin system RelE/ParE family toxin [Deltaproteobacteria bacterium]MBW2301828.1 type II toxin-antitoxin system RelE/ParE family toxin [Deltaproteobacteria bacterium]
MQYKLKYHAEVKSSDLPKIDAKSRNIIKRAIEERLAVKPEAYAKPLQRTLKGYWKLRVGDYRIVFKVSGDSIFIFGIIHRKDIYTLVKKRI